MIQGKLSMQLGTLTAAVRAAADRQGISPELWIRNSIKAALGRETVGRNPIEIGDGIQFRRCQFSASFHQCRRQHGHDGAHDPDLSYP
jgi:hypothetical protein